MYHSITFVPADGSSAESMNTWNDWHLIPSSRPVIAYPQPALRFLSIPGKNGSVDVTELMGKTVLYEDRNGSLEFFVDNGHEDWVSLWERITNYIHGKRMQLILEDDPGFYYEGRIYLDKWHSDRSNSRIVFNYRLNPYKRCVYNYGDDWKWDNLVLTDSSEAGYYVGQSEDYIWEIPNYTGVDVSLGFTIRVEGYGYRTIPIITTTTDKVQLQFDGGSWIKLPLGQSQPSNVIITTGYHTLKFRGTGRVSIVYRGGSL